MMLDSARIGTRSRTASLAILLAVLSAGTADAARPVVLPNGSIVILDEADDMYDVSMRNARRMMTLLGLPEAGQPELDLGMG